MCHQHLSNRHRHRQAYVERGARARRSGEGRSAAQAGAGKRLRAEKIAIRLLARVSATCHELYTRGVGAMQLYERISSRKLDARSIGLSPILLRHPSIEKLHAKIHIAHRIPDDIG